MMVEDTQIIFILDDDESIISVMKEYIGKNIPNIKIYTFTDHMDMLNNPLLLKVSLFIIDIHLNSNVAGYDVAAKIYSCGMNVPFLFISGGDYNYEYFEKFKFTYDFISKPFDQILAVNRIKVLLKVSNSYKIHETEKMKLQVSLKELFDYSNIYMVILDVNMNIKLCSYLLAKDLGYETENEMIGLSWKQFLIESDRRYIDNFHKEILKNSQTFKKSLREVVTTLLTKSKHKISVKWFNSRIDNSHTYTFSIGIPIDKKITPQDGIDSIRAYWRDVLEKDATTLTALKSTLKETNEC